MAAPALDQVRGLGGRLRGLSRIRRVGLMAALAWVVLVASYAIGFLGLAAGRQGAGASFVDGLFLLIVLVLPLVLVALAAWLAEELARQRAVVAALTDLVPPLIGALDGTRAALQAQGRIESQDFERAVEAAAARTAGLSEAQVGRLTAGQNELRTMLTTMLAESRRRPAATAAEPPPAAERAPVAPRPVPAPPPPPEPAAETTEALPLLPEAEEDGRPDWATLIRALDFPRDESDREGFRALKAALRHHGLAQMLQAAEDVLTMLSQQGVFVDDLEPGPSDPDAWRRFMAGNRGAEVAAVGAVRDPQALEAARALTRSDPIFRDAALFFQRRFDAVLGEFARDVDDDAIQALADTRSARAFMLLARLSGSFG